MAAGNIDLWVSSGSFEVPYYQFYTNADGTEELTDLSLDSHYSYTFRRLGGSPSHPFYVSDTGYNQASTEAIALSGEGSPSRGITGSQYFTLAFNDGAANEIERLNYYCSAHSLMLSSLSINSVFEQDGIYDNSINGVQVGRDSLDNYILRVSGEPVGTTQSILVRDKDGAIINRSDRGDYIAIAAYKVEDGYRVLWNLDVEEDGSINHGSEWDRFLMWNLDSTGTLIDDLRPGWEDDRISHEEFYSIEDEFNLDLNKDGDVGNGYVLPAVRGTSLYAVVDGSTWLNAEERSNSLGGSLVSVETNEENSFLLEGVNRRIQYLGGDGFYWLGIADLDGDGQYSWSSGSDGSFENWGPGEPSGQDVFGEENYGFTINFLDGDPSESHNGRWYDTTLNGNGLIHRGIAEIPFIRRGDSAYVIVQGPTWEEAEANAIALGGHLVTINDAEENEWIHSKYQINTNVKNGTDRSQTRLYWAGLNDSKEEGVWEWSSGEEVTYTNWDIGEPSGGIEDYLHLGWVSPKWNDAFNELFPESIVGGIAEIPLAPNNAPTGTPNLSGDFKVGQTISIDASDIEDADNFDGWTPTYEYSWEVSGDDGTTWTELTSADATDGDNSYTLTSAEVGKQLRGVVSYLDGYGTNEVVESISSPSTESGVEVSVFGHSSVGQYLDLDIQFTDSEALPIRWLGWQAKAPDSAIVIKASDLTYEFDNSDGVISFFYKEEHLIGQHEHDDPAYPYEGIIDLRLNGFTYPLYVGLEQSEDDHTIGFIDDLFVDHELPHQFGHSALWIPGDERSQHGDSQQALFTPRENIEDPGLGFFELAPEIDLKENHQFFDIPSFVFTSGNSLHLEDELMGFEVRAYAALELKDGRFEFVYSEPVVIDGPLPFDAVYPVHEGELINHSPEGELLIAGETEIGGTISLDVSSITDADGIDSDFTYSWQVLDGDTDTWFDRINSDASDGDASYTLTNDDEGELLRAQVSYVDGNGLTEIVTSDSFVVGTPFPDAGSYQYVVTRSADIGYRPGGSIRLPLIYNVSTGDANLSGLTLNVHYDSTLLASEGADDGVTGMIEAAISTTADLADIDDLDNDPMTDRMVQLVWGSFNNSFPDQDLPLQIANVSFESLEDPSAPVDSLTGSRINFTASGTAAGYDFLPSTTTLTPRGFDLDVDGDGEVTALGDGLMIIRKLFGPAFAGDKLTNKAISPDATRTTEEIHDFIQDGIDAGDLDVDQDGNTTALGDGLMVIRHLFGAAFSGGALTSKALSPDSPYASDERPWEAVAENIDGLYF